MYFVYNCNGGLSSAIFRYLACCILCIKYKGEYLTTFTPIPLNKMIEITDIDFLEILEKDIILQESVYYMLKEYYQHDIIYEEYKEDIIKFILNNDHIIFIPDNNNNNKINNKPAREIIKIKDFLKTPINIPQYDMVFNISLGYKIKKGDFIPIRKILTLINKLPLDLKFIDSCAIVCDIDGSLFEKLYVEEVKKSLNKKFLVDCVIENNNKFKNYHIMSNARVLICSNSKLSWLAGFFSNNLELCYMPKNERQNKNSTFCYPIENTIFYDN